MSWKALVHLIAPLAVLTVAGCAGGNQPAYLPSDTDPLELARQGLAPFPPERVRTDIEQRVEDLRQSGPDDRELRPYAAKLVEDWEAIATRVGADVQFGEWECFAGGCAIVSRHAPGGSLTQTLAEFSHSKAFLRWNAGKFQSAPLPSRQGLIEVTWILFTPGKEVQVMSSDKRFEDFEANPSERRRAGDNKQ